MTAHRFTPLQMIETLVAFDTTSRNSNLALIDFVADYLAGHGVAVELIRNADGTKANLFATIGRDGADGVVLSGHTDVVPVDGQNWQSDPFVAQRRDGRLYGRGTADMKSFIAVALALAPEFAASPLGRPIHLALSYDEEIGCLGVGGIVAHLRSGRPRPALVIVGEPTEMNVVNAHKSILALDTVVTGLEAHSSATDQGVNAIAVAVELIGALARLGDELAAADPLSRGPPRRAREGRRDPRFHPPHSTVHVGTIAGGTARNIIPRQCRFQWEIRAIRTADEAWLLDRFAALVAQDFQPRLSARHPDCAIHTTTGAHVPGLVADPGSPAETLALKLAGSNRTHAVSFATEAGIFQQAGIATVVCGPGNIREAHRPNEYIEMAQVEACEAFLRRLMDELRQNLTP